MVHTARAPFRAGTSEPAVYSTAAAHQLETDELPPQARHIFMKLHEYAVDLDLGIIPVRLEFPHQSLLDLTRLTLGVRVATVTSAKYL